MLEDPHIRLFSFCIGAEKRAVNLPSFEQRLRVDGGRHQPPKSVITRSLHLFFFSLLLSDSAWMT